MRDAVGVMRDAVGVTTLSQIVEQICLNCLTAAEFTILRL